VVPLLIVDVPNRAPSKQVRVVDDPGPRLSFGSAIYDVSALGESDEAG
jgi:hypothetical protein